jgi:two-component SAPR family response regulator
MLFRFSIISILLSVYTVNFNPGQAQSYGLAFESFEAVQDKRTGLDLTPEKTVCFDQDFEIAFDIAFLPDKKNYFGYILRLIENDTRNVDILYDNSDATTQHFKVVTGDRFSSIAFDIPIPQLHHQWNRIRLIFNKKQKNITLIAGNKSFSHPYEAAAKGCFKVLFGASSYKNFNTTDVPPMKVRNVEIKENGTAKYSWPLDEMAGNHAPELHKKANGLASNPLWIKKMHHDWNPLKTFVINGPARIACDQTSGIVHVTGQDSLISYRIATGQISRSAYNPQSFFMDNQILYEKATDKIYNLFINEKSVSSLDLKSGKWDKNLASGSLKTHFLHANKFYSQSDSAIYILGGYGHLEYKGNVQKYDLKTGSWTDLSRKDTLFTPRYLASLGRAEGGAYVIGGYGSTTGKQILNPRNWYDLLYFNTKDATFRRVYNLKIPGEDFVFANSMVVNEKEKSFYALIFPKDKFTSELQLVRGSLEKPEYQLVGSKIPYQFIDTESFADLFFDQYTNRFVAVTLFKTDKNQTRVSIYSLYSPPLETVAPAKTEAARANADIWLVAVSILLIAGVFVFLRFRRIKVNPDIKVEPIVAKEPVQSIADERLAGAIAEKTSEPRLFPLQNSILLFGNLQIFDEEGHEITKSFTPLLRELFLVLLLFSIRREGISSEKLKELLWFDKNSESARNNRSVNIAKLKGILDKLKHCHISKETGYWRLNIDDEQIRVDYAEYLTLVSGKRTLSKSDITELANITKRGSFLSNQEYEWLDSFKSEVSNEIVDAYLRYASSVTIAEDPEFLIKLANYIFYFDPVNEEAMTIKCKALAYLGKHSLAKTTFENFAREYSRIYGEEFRKDMPEVLHS